MSAKQLLFDANIPSEIKIDRQSFDKLAELLGRLAGIELPYSSKNITLMTSRLGKILRRRNLASYAEYIKPLSRGEAPAISEFISAMTTNTTQFFREEAHFQVLRNLLPEVLNEKSRTQNREIRVWCAASSAGQEPYTIAMTLLESIPNPDAWSIKLLATDIDLKILDYAARGVYTSAEAESAPKLILQKYFDSRTDKGEKHFRVKKEVRDLVTFAPFNLLNETYSFRFPFDFIFCRNVLIYFNRPNAATVINKLANCLHPRGYLFLGHSEAGMVRSSILKSVSHAVYHRITSTATKQEKNRGS